MVQAIGVKVNAGGDVVVVYAPRRAKGSRVWTQRAPRDVSKHTRCGSGARYLYSDRGAK